MDPRFEDILNRLSPAQLDALYQQAKAMADAARPQGVHLRVDWGGCIDSEHADGLEAQRVAMQDWTRSIERSSKP